MRDDQFAVGWAEEQRNFGALWLWGEALRQRGEEAEAAQKQQLALLLPLADGAARHQLATTMKRLGHRDAANVQWALILQTDEFISWHYGNAAQELGNAIAATQPSRAASLWEQMTLRVLEPSTFISETRGLLDLPHVIHKMRGKGLLGEGHVDEAFRRCIDLEPDNKLFQSRLEEFQKAAAPP